MVTRTPPRPEPSAKRIGTLIVSLDFELLWGIRDIFPPDGGTYRSNLIGVRTAIPRILELFARYEVAGTWATVGMLFARTRDELRSLFPSIRPQYGDARLDAYAEPVGDDERADPLHFAPSLIEMIRDAPLQELASHTFSHFYCLEAGQTREAFRADLEAAKRAAAGLGVTLRSLVLPRNQHNPAYASEIREAGFDSYRGPTVGWMHRPTAFADDSKRKRVVRLLDSYVPLTGHNLREWSRVREPNGLCNLPASRFLRPWSQALRWIEPRRLGRIERSLEAAARHDAIFHLWWHPHNFGVGLEANIAALEQVLKTFARLRESGRMQSLTMGAAAEVAHG